MSEVGFTLTKTRILKLLLDLEETELEEIEHWISKKSYLNDLENMRTLARSDEILLKYAKVIKKMVPLGAEFSSETINTPSHGDNTDCTSFNTTHVDSFLYDDAEVDELVEQGKLKRHYCTDCKSQNIEKLFFISHSMPRESLEYMFLVLLPGDLEGKQILDVGSRLGAVLFAAYHLSNASNIIGVEINKEWCDTQETLMNKFSMDKNRIKNIHSDVLQCEDIVASSDIIVVNALEFFIDKEQHKNIWQFMKKSIKKGSYLATNRCMTDLLDCLGLSEELMGWLTICKPCQMQSEILFDVEEFDFELFLYVIN